MTLFSAKEIFELFRNMKIFPLKLPVSQYLTYSQKKGRNVVNSHTPTCNINRLPTQNTCFAIYSILTFFLFFFPFPWCYTLIFILSFSFLFKWKVVIIIMRLFIMRKMKEKNYFHSNDCYCELMNWSSGNNLNLERVAERTRSMLWLSLAFRQLLKHPVLGRACHVAY